MIGIQTGASNNRWITTVVQPTVGQSPESRAIEERLARTVPGAVKPQRAQQSLPERLFDALASFKVFASQVAMHLGTAKRDSLFKQLDSLLDPEEWPEEDIPPELGSFRTLLRILLVVQPRRGPSLGASSRGRLVAAWTAGHDRLTIECFSNDRIRWVLSVGEGEERRIAAGESLLKHLVAELAPYGRERWFG